ncbi:ATP-binding protein [Novosphingobium flavum]|uniref:ATP-binding protein n=1 Tax=Novosphingobium flavum TaxID=1778672 RepID=A0A7X1FVE2_9SPHN|nr:histidine kinase [Novosphingobium flavum]MBC2667112.1 ATP-binding protein [Novosphingobium flavum]
MSVKSIFEYRSARVIAVYRAALSLVFLLALMLDPSRDGLHETASRLLLFGYFTVSLALILLAWKSWWFDHMLAPFILVLDSLVFISGVFFTEQSTADFTSPFLSVLSLVALSAIMRWDWRVAAWTGFGLTALFVATGMAMMSSGLEIDTYRFVRRISYMVALLAVLLWFGVQRRAPHVPAIAPPVEGDDEEELMARAMDYARELTGASKVLLAWSPAEEPWVEIRRDGPDGLHAQRAGPKVLDDWEPAYAAVELFDMRRRRSLLLDDEDRVQPTVPHIPAALTPIGGITEGLQLPFHNASGDGLLLLGGISGPGADFLHLGKAIAREIGSAFDRAVLGELERAALVGRTRSAIARDLHDSVAQSLAGACFRLEGLRRNLGGRLVPEADSEIVAIRDALRREQGHIRGLIDSLRAPAQPPRSRDLRGDMDGALADAGAHWGVAVALDAPGPVEVTGWLSHEVQQLVREAVANAARHGHAERVTVRLGLAHGRLALQIEDNGIGFDAASQDGRPWSIRERVAAIGGEFALESTPGSTVLAIELPAHNTRG